MDKQNETNSIKVKVPACSCIVEINEKGLKPIKLCPYHESVSKCGLGRIFTGS